MVNDNPRPQPRELDPVKSRSVGDFLKAVYALQQSAEVVSTNALSEALRIKPPSITDMARRMDDAGYVEYKRYRGVRLTEKGHITALQLLRRHRLIELYLVEELGYELREVHDEADALEHAVSDRFVEAVAAKLGQPTHDPHGDPIPAQDGSMARRDLVPLTDVALDESATVRRLIAESDDMLQHILDRGFALGTDVTVTARDPFEGPVTLCIDGVDRIIGHNVAATIMVEVHDGPDEENNPA